MLLLPPLLVPVPFYLRVFARISLYSPIRRNLSVDPITWLVTGIVVKEVCYQ
jgi:hypothetical protein